MVLRDHLDDEADRLLDRASDPCASARDAADALRPADPLRPALLEPERSRTRRAAMTAPNGLRTYHVHVNAHRYSDHSDPAHRTSILWRSFSDDPQTVADDVRTVRERVRTNSAVRPYVGIIHEAVQVSR